VIEKQSTKRQFYLEVAVSIRELLFPTKQKRKLKACGMGHYPNSNSSI
jgi:hypothetical protein